MCYVQHILTHWNLIIIAVKVVCVAVCMLHRIIFIFPFHNDIYFVVVSVIDDVGSNKTFAFRRFFSAFDFILLPLGKLSSSEKAEVFPLNCVRVC